MNRLNKSVADQILKYQAGSEMLLNIMKSLYRKSTGVFNGFIVANGNVAPKFRCFYNVSATYVLNIIVYIEYIIQIHNINGRAWIEMCHRSKKSS